MTADVDKRIDDDARAAARRLRRLIQDEPSLMEAVAYLLDAASPETHASDRLISIFAGTLLECALRDRNSKFKNEARTDGDFDQLFASDRNGVPGTFGSRILIGWALSLFGPKACADLKRVNQIRNAFAHSLQSLHFEHQDIRSLCEALGTYELIPYELGRENELRLEALNPSTRNHFRANRNSPGGWPANPNSSRRQTVFAQALSIEPLVVDSAAAIPILVMMDTKVSSTSGIE